MKPGQASVTAQRVAAQRLTFDRHPAPYGDPAADERLARDVAGDVVLGASPMRAYLAARTSFFDRVVVGAIDRGVTQIVIGAAGYDGRALRYAKPGVRWFEVDHPSTQQDKRERLDRLGVTTSQISFVAADFAVDSITAGLRGAGLDTGSPTLFLLEGVVVYLERPVVESVLRQFRELAAVGSRLAVSLSVATGSPVTAARRDAFQSAVARLGEPARTVIAAHEAEQLFAGTGWRLLRPAEGAGAGNRRSGRARAAGLVIAEPA